MTVLESAAGSVAQSYYDANYHRTYRSVLLQPDVWDCWVEMIDWYYFTDADRRATMFEYGCGFGQAIVRRGRAGWDISAEARTIARQQGAQVFESMDDVTRGTWDRVFCRHVLEHIEDPLTALREMRDLLTPDGELILVLPRETHANVPMTADWSQHLYCWNFLTINNLLLRAGLTPIANEIRYPLGWTRLATLRKHVPSVVFQAIVRAGSVLRLHGEHHIRAVRTR